MRPVDVRVQSVGVRRLCIKMTVCEWCGDSVGTVWGRRGDGVVSGRKWLILAAAHSGIAPRESRGQGKLYLHKPKQRE